MTFIATRRATQKKGKRFRPWTPKDVQASLSAWYDGMDASTITTVSGNISQWNDKSGLGNHLLQGTAAARPAYSFMGASFSTNSHLLATVSNANVPLGSASRYVYYVYNVYSGRSTDEFIVSWGSGSGASWYANFLTTTGGNNGIDPKVLTSATNTANSGSPLSVNTNMLIASEVTASTIVANKNGTNVLNTTNSGMNTTASLLFMGCNVDNSRHFGGLLYEMLILNALPAGTTQRMEGYLAWKWRTNGLLPASHPYKSGPPLVEI